MDTLKKISKLSDDLIKRIISSVPSHNHINHQKAIATLYCCDISYPEIKLFFEHIDNLKAININNFNEKALVFCFFIGRDMSYDVSEKIREGLSSFNTANCGFENANIINFLKENNCEININFSENDLEKEYKIIVEENRTQYKKKLKNKNNNHHQLPININEAERESLRKKQEEEKAKFLAQKIIDDTLKKKKAETAAKRKITWDNNAPIREEKKRIKAEAIRLENEKQYEINKKIFKEKLELFKANPNDWSYENVASFVGHGYLKYLTEFQTDNFASIGQYLGLSKEKIKEYEYQSYRNVILHASEVPDFLGISKELYKKWREQGLIKIYGYQQFSKWGKDLYAATHTKEDLLYFKEGVPDLLDAIDKKKEKKITAQRLKEAKFDIIKQEILGWFKQTCESLGYEPISLLCYRKKMKVNVLIGDENFVLVSYFQKELSNDLFHFIKDKKIKSLNDYEQFFEKDNQNKNLALTKINENLKLALVLLDETSKILAQGTENDTNGIVFKIKEKVLSSLRTLLLASIDIEYLTFNFFADFIKERSMIERKVIGTLLIKDELKLEEYEKIFKAYHCNRHFHIIVGPTNSGKTYQAIESLKQAKSGVYLAPLRLLAHEVYDKLNQCQTPCNLITGEQIIKEANSFHEASTIEMLDIEKNYEVAVIDECQMVNDRDRGWAWTSAILGVCASTVYLIGSGEGLEQIKALIKLSNGTFEITHTQRKTPLEITNEPIRLKNLKSGDALIVFSRQEVLDWAYELELLGWSVSKIYGALSPKTRIEQSQLFLSRKNEIVVATDAIGMGLNLPIERLFFTKSQKYDGISSRDLTNSEIKQIAGRAGRFGQFEKGYVGVLDTEDNNHSTDLKIIRNGIESPMAVSSIQSVQIAPTLSHLKALSYCLNSTDISYLLSYFAHKIPLSHPLYRTAKLDNVIQVASIVEQQASNLSLSEKMIFSFAPFKLGVYGDTNFFTQCLDCYCRGKTMGLYLFDNKLSHKNSLSDLEVLSRELNLFSWLSLKFKNFLRQDNHIHIDELAERVSNLINKQLLQKKINRRKPIKQYNYRQYHDNWRW